MAKARPIAPEPETEPDPLALFEEAQARLRAANPDMTQDDWDRVAEVWIEEVEKRIRLRIQRGQPV